MYLVFYLYWSQQCPSYLSLCGIKQKSSAFVDRLILLPWAFQSVISCELRTEIKTFQLSSEKKMWHIRFHFLASCLDGSNQECQGDTRNWFVYTNTDISYQVHCRLTVLSWHLMFIWYFAAIRPVSFSFWNILRSFIIL